MAWNIENNKKPTPEGQPIGSPGAPETLSPAGGPSSEISPDTLKLLGISHPSQIPEAIKEALASGKIVEVPEPRNSPED